MERELSLKRTQYYSDPNTAMREQYQYPGGRGGEINDIVKKIDEKKQKIEQDKQAISDLEDQLRKEGLPSGWSRP
jgi:ABC-type Fe3+-citrate transport system substrate-binding protein